MRQNSLLKEKRQKKLPHVEDILTWDYALAEYIFRITKRPSTRQIGNAAGKMLTNRNLSGRPMPIKRYFRTRPNNNEITNSTRKIKNKTLAILAAPAAIPPKPNIAAIKATTRNMIVQRNILNFI